MLQHRQQEIRYGFRGNSCIRDACSPAAVFMNRGDTGRDPPEGCFLQGWNPWMKGSGMIADLLNGGGKANLFPGQAVLDCHWIEHAGEILSPGCRQECL